MQVGLDRRGVARFREASNIRQHPIPGATIPSAQLAHGQLVAKTDKASNVQTKMNQCAVWTYSILILCTKPRSQFYQMPLNHSQSKKFTSSQAAGGKNSSLKLIWHLVLFFFLLNGAIESQSA